MTVEVDCGIIRGTKERRFRVYAGVCDEFPTQLDVVTVTYGGAVVFTGKPGDAKTPFEQQAVAHAQACVSEFQWNDEVVEDF